MGRTVGSRLSAALQLIISCTMQAPLFTATSTTVASSHICQTGAHLKSRADILSKPIHIIYPK